MLLSLNVKLTLLVTFVAAAQAVDLRSLFSQRERKLDNSCQEAAFDIIDAGYTDEFQGWYDPLGCGICNQYCRWVGNSESGGDPSASLSHDGSWWSCQTGTESAAGEIWSRYDSIGDSFPFPKCGHKNEGGAATPSPIRVFEKVQNNVFRFHQDEGQEFSTQTLIIDSVDLSPGQYRIVDVQVKIHPSIGLLEDGTIRDAVTIDGNFVFLSKGDFKVALCSYTRGSDPWCRSGTTIIQPHGTPVPVRESNLLSLFEGEDPVGEWTLSLRCCLPGSISQWSLSLTIMDQNGNRRSLRGNLNDNGSYHVVDVGDDSQE